jgi:hypothetical protein
MNTLTRKHRSPAWCIVWSFVTLIYIWYWLVTTKTDLNAKTTGRKCPTAWFWLIPVVGCLYWNYRYAEVVADIFGESEIGTFLLVTIFPMIATGVLQSKYNKGVTDK